MTDNDVNNHDGNGATSNEDDDDDDGNGATNYDVNDNGDGCRRYVPLMNMAGQKFLCARALFTYCKCILFSYLRYQNVPTNFSFGIGMVNTKKY